jgi:uncharacterized protein (DUF488 family)
MPKLFTIGFTQKSAAEFFDLLQKAGVKRVIDTRLNNTSQLSGFAKQADLQYFLSTIAKIDYEHNLSLAPTQEILTSYKQKKMSWEEYERHYLDLVEDRKIESNLNLEQLENCCFLCSEHQPHFCHRRLAAEYLKSRFGDLDIIHLI